MTYQHKTNPVEHSEQEIANEGFNDDYKIPIQANYGYDSVSDSFIPFSADVDWDYTGLSNPDSNGNYQTIIFKQGGSSGTTVKTLALTYDASNNVTSITRS